jgi:3-hydroxybutyryl-CoA dehydrogenase
MGRGIAQVAAQAGHRVLLYDVDVGALAAARVRLEEDLLRLEGKGRLSEAPWDILSRIEGVSELEAFREAAWVVEAAPESLELKRTLFGELDAAAPRAVLASNTSTLSITAIAGATEHPERVVGLHFFNPAPLMKLVEVVPGLETSPEVVARAVTFAQSLGKTPAVAKDVPGFIVNRVARPFYGEALKLHGEGIPFEGIDGIMRGLGFRMGPFELMDLIGLDVNLAASEAVYGGYFQEPRYRPHPLQTRMVGAGYLGRKTGRGFYAYPREAQEATAPTVSGQPPKALIIGSNALALAMKEAFGHGLRHGEDPQGAELIIDARIPVSRKSYLDAPQGVPVLTAVWGHSASLSMKYYKQAVPIAGFSLVPPFEDPVAELYLPVTGENEAVAVGERYFKAHGLKTLTLSDQPGGVGFRIVAMLMNEALSALAEGVASASDIDRAMTLGTNYPRGPLAWSEALGLEHLLLGLEGLFDELGEDRYRPHPLLKRYVAAGLTSWK